MYVDDPDVYRLVIYIGLRDMHMDGLNVSYSYCYNNTKQKQPGCKKVRGQSEATMVTSDQKL